jgi:perosamine synthetase
MDGILRVALKHKIFEKEIQKFTKSKYVIATINGTSALQAAIACLSPKDGDEILTTDISFISSVNAIHYNNCSPVFIGINNKFLLSEYKLETFLQNETYFKNGKTFNKKTKKRIIAILTVNTFGNLLNYKKIKNILKGRNIKIIEDAAESFGSFYKFKKKKIHSGLLGDIGCFSFNVNKIVTTGGGGAIITNNLKLYKIIKHIINQSKIDPINFIHDRVGYNFSLPSVNSSLGISQVKNMSKILKKKRNIHEYYAKMFEKNSKHQFLSFKDDDNYKSNFWLNILKLNTKKKLSQVIKYLQNNEISVRPIWSPLSKQIFNKKFQNFLTNDTCEIINKVICLPSGYDLTKKQLNFIINKIKKIN